MAYDGIVVAATVSELKRKLLGGSIVKVAQPEKDELLFTVKVNRSPVRLLLSANASVPMVCIRESGELSPVEAPAFCMSLRKHIGGGRILEITQAPGLERIIIFRIEHMDEMGDRNEKLLIAELMGKHSNIILTRADGTIIDSIRHVSAMTSSLREVLPGRTWFLPETKHSGFGRVMDCEIAERAGVDPGIPFPELSEVQKEKLECEKAKIRELVCKEQFRPCIIYQGGKAVEFSALPLMTFPEPVFSTEFYDSISEVVWTFYEKKEIQNRIRAKSEDIRQILKSLTERISRKLDIQEKQFADTQDREKNRIYGELLNVYGYGLKDGEKVLRCENFYDDYKEIEIPLDEHRTAQENAVKYFNKYQKLKRTAKALEEQIRENREHLYRLDLIKNNLCFCENEADVREIRDELEEAGFIRKNTVRAGKIRKEEKRSAPMHFVSSDGLDIFAGRNNLQNEELDFKIAGPDDWWFHAKKIPGSHVIVKTGKAELPDRTCLEAASLAAFFSKAGREDDRSLVEVDYVRRKELKKVPGAPKGYVIYHTNYSILVKPEMLKPAES